MKTEITEISPILKKTLIFKEDRFFYYHLGVNPIAVLRAAVMNTLHLKRTSGASTITMQVARMLEPKHRTYGNKLIEIFRAWQLEWKYSKEEILQLYFNLVPYGSNVEGVKSASVLFFEKSPDQLSLAEVTALSIIPNRPSSLKLGVKNDFIFQERNRWLKRFQEEGLFTSKEIADALDEPLNVHRHNAPALAPHLSYRVKKMGDAIIRTTVDLNMQLNVEKLVSDYSQSLYNQQIKNAAVLVLNNRTHEVVAYIGSANFRNTEDGGQVDGIKAIRQPGSTLKPLLYGLCIDNGICTPKTIMNDVPININGYTPENFDKKFNGYVTMEYALSNSLNIPAVKSLNDLGKERLIKKLIDADFKQIKKDQNKLGLSMILGGCGVSLEELTTLFSSFATNGIYHSSVFFVGDTSRRQAILLSLSSNFMITEILSRITRPDLPVNWEQSQHLPRIAWKTGTSYGRKDAWSIGFNKDYTVGVWLGNFSGQGVAELSGANTATPLLFKIFNTIDYNAANDWFAMPKECNIRLVCSETGKLPNDFCTSTVMDYFIPMVSSNQFCDNMKEVCVSANEKISYCKNCLPTNGYKKKLFKVVPPEMQSYFEDNRIAYEHIPPHNPECDRVFVEGAPKIVYPVNGVEYFIDKNATEPIQLKCDVTNEVKIVFWYINNKFFKKCNARDKQFFVPEEGNVKISCTDDKGRNDDVWIKVKMVKL
jgi:penicillin-binding protein 1C